MATGRRRLTPYLLLFPGVFWLVVFFVVPMYYMARLSLDSGTIETGFEFSWQWSNYHDALTLYNGPVHPGVRVRGRGDDHRAR